jgi:branched-chain amino acid aminotransferase
MVAASEEVLARNSHFLTPDTDYWIGQRVSRGVDAVGDEGWDHTGPNVIVECIPLPLKSRARLFRDGIDIVVPPTRRVAPDMLSPRAKTHNYLNLVMADLEAKAQDKEAWSVLLDAQGHLAEGIGSNIFVVRGGEVLTPNERWVLPGVSRATVIELCGELGIPCREADLDLYDASTADEIFMSSTSLCLCPVRSIGGRALPAPVPGPVTRRLTEAYAKFVDCDFVAQYLKHLA